MNIFKNKSFLNLEKFSLIKCLMANLVKKGVSFVCCLICIPFELLLLKFMVSYIFIQWATAKLCAAKEQILMIRKIRLSSLYINHNHSLILKIRMSLCSLSHNLSNTKLLYHKNCNSQTIIATSNKLLAHHFQNKVVHLGHVLTFHYLLESLAIKYIKAL